MRNDKHRLIKEPSEKFVVAVNFNEVLGSGETILTGSSVVTAYDATGSIFSDLTLPATLFVSGSNLGITIQSGSRDQTYRTVFKAVTSDSNIWTDSVYVTVLQL